MYVCESYYIYIYIYRLTFLFLLNVRLLTHAKIFKGLFRKCELSFIIFLSQKNIFVTLFNTFSLILTLIESFTTTSTLVFASVEHQDKSSTLV